MKQSHVVFIAADNTNVFSGTKGEEVPSWAKIGRIQILASDYDWTHDLYVGNEELARDSGSHVHGADNLGNFDWLKPHYEFDVKRRGGTTFDILLDINVVTAGTGLAIIQWEG